MNEPPIFFTFPGRRQAIFKLRTVSGSVPANLYPDDWGGTMEQADDITPIIIIKVINRYITGCPVYYC